MRAATRPSPASRDLPGHQPRPHRARRAVSRRRRPGPGLRDRRHQPGDPRRARRWRQGFDVEQITEFTYHPDAGAERAWLSVPIFTKHYLPGLPYQDRMRVLAEAYDRLGTGQTEPSRWVAFTARASG